MCRGQGAQGAPLTWAWGPWQGLLLPSWCPCSSCAQPRAELVPGPGSVPPCWPSCARGVSVCLGDLGFGALREQLSKSLMFKGCLGYSMCFVSGNLVHIPPCHSDHRILDLILGYCCRGFFPCECICKTINIQITSLNKQPRQSSYFLLFMMRLFLLISPTHFSRGN